MAAAAPAIVMGVGAIVSTVGSVISANQAQQTAKKNLNAQIAQQDRDNQFQEQVYEENKLREDTAIQRQVADSRAAGISPLANMSGAASNPAVAPSGQAAQEQDSPSDIGTLLSGVGAMSSILQSVAQLKQTQTQTQGMELSNQFASESMADRLSGISLSNANLKANADFANMSMTDRLKSLSLANRIAEQDVDFNDLSKDDRLKVLSLERQLKGVTLKDFNREYEHKDKYDIYATDTFMQKNLKNLFGDLGQIAGNNDKVTLGDGRSVNAYSLKNNRLTNPDYENPLNKALSDSKIGKAIGTALDKINGLIESDDSKKGRKR